MAVHCVVDAKYVEIQNVKVFKHFAIICPEKGKSMFATVFHPSKKYIVEEYGLRNVNKGVIFGMQLSENIRSLRSTIDTWYSVMFDDFGDEHDCGHPHCKGERQYDVQFYAKGADKCAVLASILKPATVLNLDDLKCPPFCQLSSERPDKWNKPVAYARWLEGYLNQKTCTTCMRERPDTKKELTQDECECGTVHWIDCEGDQCCGDCGAKLYPGPRPVGEDTVDGPVPTA
ncbi:uncharacterized protein LOC129598890 [Paramacrobiotus metropolitanus]|uniref:uncharacterized protein LOC129598890 n=1 Tax=Paramacrobiotus metropolitanus TaxID=2943436 RepID=UPI002446561A|nr:uncharacterized protein LOC129598890 [Paramacrobiotus metropolitanus]